MVDNALGVAEKKETAFKPLSVLLVPTGGHGGSGHLALQLVAIMGDSLEQELVVETHALDLTQRLSSVTLVVVLTI